MKEQTYKKKVPEEAIESAVDQVVNFGDGAGRVVDLYGLTDVELVDMMLDHQYERCVDCRWFKPSYEFIDDDQQAHDKCEECRV